MVEIKCINCNQNFKIYDRSLPYIKKCKCGHKFAIMFPEVITEFLGEFYLLSNQDDNWEPKSHNSVVDVVSSKVI